MISIGSVLKGPELRDSPIDRAIMAALRAAKELRGDFEFGSTPAVNVVFYVPGSTGSPDWDGLRDAKFSRQQKFLMVQVAVPEDAVESPAPEDFVIGSLYGANAVAFEFFRQRKIEYPLADAEALVEQIESRIREAA